MLCNCRKMTQSSSAKHCLSSSASTEKQHSWRIKTAGDDRPKASGQKHQEAEVLVDLDHQLKNVGKSVLFILFIKLCTYCAQEIIGQTDSIYLFLFIWKNHCKPLASYIAKSCKVYD